MSLHQSLIDTNVEALKEGAELLRLLESDQYTKGFKPAFQSTIGAHFRHVLEHYRCLLSQLDSRVLCYDERQRDQLLECDIDYAAQTIAELIEGVRNIDARAFQCEYQLRDQQVASTVTTNLLRELLFLQSHTVHHYAIVGAMTRAFGRQPEQDFGVAIATREHQKSCESEKTIGDAPTCAQ